LIVKQLEDVASTLHAMNNHDRHRIRTETRMRIVCRFFPALTGDEVHDADGSL
jgi:L-ectoine synthase